MLAGCTAEPPSLQRIVCPAPWEWLGLIHLSHLLPWGTLWVGPSIYSISFIGGDRWTWRDYGLSLFLWGLSFTCPSLTWVTLDWNSFPPPNKILGHSFFNRSIKKKEDKIAQDFLFFSGSFLSPNSCFLLLYSLFSSYLGKKLRILSVFFTSISYNQGWILCK